MLTLLGLPPAPPVLSVTQRLGWRQDREPGDGPPAHKLGGTLIFLLLSAPLGKPQMSTVAGGDVSEELNRQEVKCGAVPVSELSSMLNCVRRHVTSRAQSEVEPRVSKAL